MTRARRPVLVVLLSLVLFVAPGVAAFAYWSATATGSLSVTTAAPPLNPPAAPAQPTQTTSSCGTVALDWANVTSATGYRVYRRTGTSAPYSYTLLATVTDSAASINQGSLPASVVVVVTAHNADGESGYSPTRTVTITPCPTPPVLSCGSRQGAGSYSITWGNVPGADDYRIYRSTDNATFVFQTTDGAAPANLAIAANGVTYWRLTTMGNGLESSPSNTLKITRTGGGATNFLCGAP